MKKFLDILYQSSYINLLMIAVKTLYQYKNLIFILMLPFIVVYGLFYVVLLLHSFVIWELPITIPIPFSYNMMLDRILLIIGMILVCGYCIDENNY